MIDRGRFQAWAAPGPVGQLIAVTGALLALIGLIGPWPAGVGTLVLVVGVLVTAPYAVFPGPYLVEWWRVSAIGALICMVGFGLGFWLSWLGGLVLAGGAIVAIVALVFGSPVEADPAEPDGSN